MTAAAISHETHEHRPLAHSASRLVVVAGLHAGLVVALLHAPVKTATAPAPLRMEVRTIEMQQPPPQVPKSLPDTPKPQLAQPAKPQRKAPALLPAPVLSAAPSVETAKSVFTTAPDESVTPMKEAPRPLVVQGPRFDAAYLQNPAPVYPPMSRRMREEGEVLLQVRITAAGVPEQISVKQGSGFPRLDEAAVNTVQHWRFVPARRGDETIAASVIVPIVFRLES